MEKRETKDIKISTLYNKVAISAVITLVFLGLLIFYIYPNYQVVSSLKSDLETKISTYENIEKNWISYGDFMSLNKDESLKKMLWQEWSQFFDGNLKNTKKPKYLDFLQEKIIYIDEVNKSNIIKTRDEKLSKVLPSYTEWYSVEWNMTDLAFINYVESLLRTFGLRSTSQIWIQDLVVVEDEKWNKKTDNVKTQIFYIPLKLEVEWRKADIVDFIYFLQNVWVVSDVNKESLTFYKDNVINKTISWQKRLPNYNIYENKIVDIESIELPDYIDTSTIMRVWNGKTLSWFISFLKNWAEKDQVYRATLNLRFYVRWLPTYKIEIFAWEVIKSYKDLTSKVKSLLQKAQNRKWVLLNKNIVEIIWWLRTVDTYLSEMDQKVKKLEQAVKQKTNLNNIYSDTSELKYDLQNLENYIKSLNIDDNLK